MAKNSSFFDNVQMDRGESLEKIETGQRESDELVGMSFKVSKDLRRRMRLRAAQTGENMSEMVIRLVEKELRG